MRLTTWSEHRFAELFTSRPNLEFLWPFLSLCSFLILRAHQREAENPTLIGSKRRLHDRCWGGFANLSHQSLPPVNLCQINGNCLRERHHLCRLVFCGVRRQPRVRENLAASTAPKTLCSLLVRKHPQYGFSVGMWPELLRTGASSAISVAAPGYRLVEVTLVPLVPFREDAARNKTTLHF